MSSDTSTTAFNYKKEASFGLLPAAAAFAAMRFTGESLAHQKATVQSNEIRADRQVSDLVMVGASAGGGFNFELSLQEYRDLIASTMGQPGFTASSFTGEAEITAASNTMQFGDEPPTEFITSGYVKVSGCSNPANNGIKRLISVTGNSIWTFAPGSFLTDQTPFNCVITRLICVNGVAMSSYTFERGVLSDNGYVYQNYSGMTPSGMNLRIASMEIVTGGFNFLGKVGSLATRSLSRAGEIAATGTLTFTAQPAEGHTCTIGVGTGVKQFIFTALAVPSYSGGSVSVKIGASASASIDNLIDAINGGDGGDGSIYSAGYTGHTQITAAAGAGDTMVATAKLEDQSGAFGNTIATTENSANMAWGAALLTGGVNANPVLHATTDPVVNGTNNVVNISSGNGTLSDPAKSIALAINNNLRSKDKIGHLGAFEIGQGQFVATGTLEVYFENNDLYRKIVNHEDVSLAFLIQDENGNAMGVTFPRVKLADGTPATGANNNDVMMSVNFTAIQDPATGVTMIVDLFDA